MALFGMAWALNLKIMHWKKCPICRRHRVLLSRIRKRWGVYARLNAVTPMFDVADVHHHHHAVAALPASTSLTSLPECSRQSNVGLNSEGTRRRRTLTEVDVAVERVDVGCGVETDVDEVLVSPSEPEEPCLIHGGGRKWSATTQTDDEMDVFNGKKKKIYIYIYIRIYISHTKKAVIQLLHSFFSTTIWLIKNYVPF
jgi:hypothetical protein